MRLLLVPAVAAAFMTQGLVIGMVAGATAGGLAACAWRRVGRRLAAPAERASPAEEA